MTVRDCTRFLSETELYAKRLDRLSQYALTLVNDVLDLGKARAGKLELEKQPFSFLNAIAPAVDIIGSGSRAQSRGIRVVPILDPFLDVSRVYAYIAFD